MILQLAAIVTGFLMDACLGDPHGLPHPVRALGHLISWLELKLRSLFPRKKKGELWAGCFLTLFVIAVTGGICSALLEAAACLGPLWLYAVKAVMTYYLLAARSLSDESMKVYHALREGDIGKARQAVSMIVGRDTLELDESGIAKAAVETVAENTSDGVTAPLFYLALGGPLAGWLYKAVNTMDSMVGYKNDRYLYFGRAAARLDDLVNYLPSRLCALLMILTACLLPGFDGRQAAHIFLRDRLKHKSPNSAQTEAVCAGALRIQLAGDARYFGTLIKKPVIGDALRPVECGDIKKANRLMRGTALLTLAVICGGYLLLMKLMKP